MNRRELFRLLVSVPAGLLGMRVFRSAVAEQDYYDGLLTRTMRAYHDLMAVRPNRQVFATDFLMRDG